MYSRYADKTEVRWQERHLEVCGGCLRYPTLDMRGSSAASEAGGPRFGRQSGLQPDVEGLLHEQ